MVFWSSIPVRTDVVFLVGRHWSFVFVSRGCLSFVWLTVHVHSNSHVVSIADRHCLFWFADRGYRCWATHRMFGRQLPPSPQWSCVLSKEDRYSSFTLYVVVAWDTRTLSMGDVYSPLHSYRTVCPNHPYTLHSAAFRQYFCYTLFLICEKYRFCSTNLCAWGHNRRTNISTKHCCFSIVKAIHAIKIAW